MFQNRHPPRLRVRADADDHFPFRDGGAPPAVSGDRHAASADRIYLRSFPPGMGPDGVHAYDLWLFSTLWLIFINLRYVLTYRLFNGTSLMPLPDLIQAAFIRVTFSPALICRLQTPASFIIWYAAFTSAFMHVPLLLLNSPRFILRFLS